MRRAAPRLLAVLLALFAACGLLPNGKEEGNGVTITPAAGEKPYTLSAAAVVVPTETFREAISKAGTGLRSCGERKGILARYAVLDPAAEDFLRGALELGAEASSAPVGFAAGDEIQVRTTNGDPTRGSYAAHIMPRASGSRIDRLEVGIVGRPADGSLLPVVRAEVPVSGTGLYLVNCESGTGESFVALLRLDLAGDTRASVTPTANQHRLDVRSYTLKTDDLSRILRLEGIEERGGLGGIVLEVLHRDQVKALAGALDEEGQAAPRTDRTLEGTARTTVEVGGLSLLVSSAFVASSATYTTVVTVQNRGSIPPLTARHGDRHVLLLLGWDAESPGTSTVALLSLIPVE